MNSPNSNSSHPDHETQGGDEDTSLDFQDLRDPDEGRLHVPLSYYDDMGTLGPLRVYARARVYEEFACTALGHSPVKVLKDVQHQISLRRAEWLTQVWPKRNSANDVAESEAYGQWKEETDVELRKPAEQYNRTKDTGDLEIAVGERSEEWLEEQGYGYIGPEIIASVLEKSKSPSQSSSLLTTEAVDCGEPVSTPHANQSFDMFHNPTPDRYPDELSGLS